jgi:hypothetical protein
MIANKDAHSKWQVDTPYKMLFEMPQKDSKKSTRCFAARYNSLIASYDSLTNEIPLIKLMWTDKRWENFVSHLPFLLSYAFCLLLF